MKEKDLTSSVASVQSERLNNFYKDKKDGKRDGKGSASITPSNNKGNIEKKEKKEKPKSSTNLNKDQITESISTIMKYVKINVDNNCNY